MKQYKTYTKEELHLFQLCYKHKYKHTQKQKNITAGTQEKNLQIKCQEGFQNTIKFKKEDLANSRSNEIDNKSTKKRSIIPQHKNHLQYIHSPITEFKVQDQNNESEEFQEAFKQFQNNRNNQKDDINLKQKITQMKRSLNYKIFEPKTPIKKIKKGKFIIKYNL